MTKWRYIVEKELTSSYGLAVDEMLAHSVAYNDSVPILHLYNFVPSVIVGRYQDIEAAIDFEECKKYGVEYNRRHTGGGTVLMGPYQLALGFAISLDNSQIPSRSIRTIFDVLGGIINNALDKIGINSKFRPKNDIEVNGKKIAGLSASLEEKNCLFFHMSLLLDFDIELMLKVLNISREKVSDKAISCFSQRLTTIKDELGTFVPMSKVMKVIRDAFSKGLGVSFVESDFSSWEKLKVEELMRQRYNCQDWIFSVKHPRTNAGYARKKTRGGMLQVYLTTSGGAIESALITGDFFSTTADINRIESALKWTASDRESVEKTLNEVMNDDTIYGVNVPVLTDVIMKAKKANRQKGKMAKG